MIPRCAVLLGIIAAAWAQARYESREEAEVLRYLNEARTNPARFAERYLAADTRRNRTAAECMREMKRLRPMPPLGPSLVLSRSAQAHAADLGRTGEMSHRGSDGSDLSRRIERYGVWTGSIAENLAFGVESPLQIVVMLLIDEGVASRGHRRNILDPKLRYAGVGIRPHRRFGTVCVQDFAAAVRER